MAQEDSLKAESKPSVIFLSADYGKGLESLIGEQLKWEFGAGFALNNRIVITGEYGYGSLEPSGVVRNGYYRSVGNYYRLGLEYMFEITLDRYLSLGAMYGASVFDDEGNIQIDSELWPDLNETFTRQGLHANWTELILNSEGPVTNAPDGFLKNVFWGMRIRLRILFTDTALGNDYDIYSIPGFGKTYSPVVPALNLFIKYRFTL